MLGRSSWQASVGIMLSAIVQLCNCSVACTPSAPECFRMVSKEMSCTILVKLLSPRPIPYRCWCWFCVGVVLCCGVDCLVTVSVKTQGHLGYGHLDLGTRKEEIALT